MNSIPPAESSIQKTSVAVIGGGLAGLSAALELERKGLSADLFEKSDALGGKLRTDEVDGFKLDRGYQVILPGYSEWKRLAVLDEVDFRVYEKGAQLETDRGLRTVAFPLDNPIAAARSLFQDVVSAKDVIALARLLGAVYSKSNADELLAQTNLQKISATHFLRQLGFTDRFNREFWLPFFSGIFLEPLGEKNELQTSAALFAFLVRIFAGQAVGTPAAGVEAIPRALLRRLRLTRVHLNSAVEVMSAKRLRVNGEEREFGAIVDTTVRHRSSPQGQVTTVWLGGPSKQLARLRRYGKQLALVSRSDASLLNHFAVVSNVAPTLAPTGQTLVSLNSIGILQDDQIGAVLQQFERVIGPEAKHLRILRVDRIENSFSLLSVGTFEPSAAPTQQSALAFGRRLAEGVQFL